MSHSTGDFGEDRIATRARMSLDAALKLHPSWRLRPDNYPDQCSVIRAVEFSDTLVSWGYCGLVHTPEPALLTAMLENFHQGAMVINEPTDWLFYNGQRVIIWNKFKADPTMLSVTDIVRLTDRTQQNREIEFTIHGSHPFTIKLAPDSVVLLVSERTLGDMIESYDSYFILHGNLIQIVHNIHRIGRLLPILEPEAVIIAASPEMGH